MVEGSRDLIVLLSPDGTLIYSSPSIRQVLGYSQDFNINREIWHLIHPDDIHDAWQGLRETVVRSEGEDEVTGVTFRIRHADGKWRWIEAKATNRLADAGVGAIVVACRDMTGRVRTERQLLDDIARISGILDATGDALVALNESDQIVLFNRAAVQTFGYEADEVLGEPVDMLLHRGMRDGAAELSKRLERIADDGSRVVQVLARRSGGEEFPAELTASRAEIGQRRLFVVSIRDVSPRMEIQRALIENEQTMRDAFDLAGSGMLLVDLEGRIVRANNAMAELVDREPTALTQMKLADLVDPDDLKSDLEEFRRLVRREITSYHSNRRFIRSDGSSLMARQSVSEVTSGSGTPAFFIVTVEDISDDFNRTLAIMHAEERFEVAFEDAPVGIALIDLRERSVHSNRALRQLYGRRPGVRVDQDIVGLWSTDRIDPRAFAAFVGPTDLEKLADSLGALFEGRVESFRTEHAIERTDGKSVPALVSVSMSRDEDGPFYLIVQVEEIAAQKEREALLAQAASHDGLTGLPNRALFVDRLRQALARVARGHGKLAVLFCDIDDFKTVNDGLGHAQGDELLVAVAYRLTHAVRESDLVSRFGGDEFVILCSDLNDASEAEEVATRVVASVADGFTLSTGELRITLSVGIAMAEASERPGEVIHRADLAMYSAKRAGKNQYVVAREGAHLESDDEADLGSHPEISRVVGLDDVLGDT